MIYLWVLRVEFLKTTDMLAKLGKISPMAFFNMASVGGEIHSF